MKFFYMNISKSQAVQFSFLTLTFEKISGVPEELVTDNMKTREQYSNRRNRFWLVSQSTEARGNTQ